VDDESLVGELRGGLDGRLGQRVREDRPSRLVPLVEKRQDGVERVGLERRDVRVRGDVDGVVERLVAEVLSEERRRPDPRESRVSTSPENGVSSR
jgi:hypothetical protein